ncbi:MAG TPA: VWA domain-containing protein [Candidatus Limnocylindrales bacterium]|nr:VWA domain-containing protein [Candidatus Limnocylindrales bacterium]
MNEHRKFAPATALLLSALLLVPVAPLDAQQQQAPAQQQAQPPTVAPKISSETNMVMVAATVRDKHGQIVSNLTKSDFSLDEDGRPETISYFARENDLPLTVGLLVDTSLSQRRVLADERSASSSFIDHTLREDKKDQAFLIHFDKEVELLQDLTTSRKKLEDSLRLLDTPELEDASQSQGQGQGQGGGGRHHYGGGGTLLYDAVFLASDDLMQKQQGRKALIVLSDGVDRGSKESITSAIEAAQRANTVVYSILFKDDEPYGHRGGFGGTHVGLGGPGGYPGGYPGGGGRRYPQQREERPDGKKVLDRISKETGGRLFEVSKKQPVDQIYTQIQEELRNQYILGYVPDKSPNPADYHKIHLTTTQKDLAVQARDGYYASQPQPAPAAAPPATKAVPGS